MASFRGVLSDDGNSAILNVSDELSYLLACQGDDPIDTAAGRYRAHDGETVTIEGEIGKVGRRKVLFVESLTPAAVRKAKARKGRSK